MSFGITAALVLLGVAAVEFGILWYLFKRNARLREENRAAGAAIKQANHSLKNMEDLIGDLKKNSQKAADEKRRVDEVDNSDLVDSANALFPDNKLSND